ncbi:MAG: hypothetical protein GY928_33615 [Colwellia sp.]|nr:hypothetical protein [Colwellia sp.]
MVFFVAHHQEGPNDKEVSIHTEGKWLNFWYRTNSEDFGKRPLQAYFKDLETEFSLNNRLAILAFNNLLIALNEQYYHQFRRNSAQLKPCFEMTNEAAGLFEIELPKPSRCVYPHGKFTATSKPPQVLMSEIKNLRTELDASKAKDKEVVSVLSDILSLVPKDSKDTSIAKARAILNQPPF